MSPDREAPDTEVVGEAPVAPEAPVNHAERGREIASAGVERVKGAFGRMRERFSGFMGRVKEKTGSLAEKGANLLFGGIGAGEFYAKKAAEKTAEAVEKTTAKGQEVMTAAVQKKAEFNAKREATIDSWKDTVSMMKVKAEMKKMDKTIPYETLGAVDASEHRSATEIQERMEREMESMRAYHEDLRQKIAAKAELQARIDAIVAKRNGSASSQNEQAAA